MTVNEYLYFIYDLKKVRFPKIAHIDEIIRLVRITEVKDRLIKNLSKGYRQRVGIAGALVGNPDVLILDEPTVGLDPKQIIEIRELITKLGKNHTIILSSHILSEVQAVCKRVIIINRGHIIADDTPEELSKALSTDHTLVARVIGKEDEVIAAISSVRNVQEVKCMGEYESGTKDYRIFPKDKTDIRGELIKRLAEKNKLTLLSLTSNELTLEQIFLRLTGEDEAGQFFENKTQLKDKELTHINEAVEEALKEETAVKGEEN